MKTFAYFASGGYIKNEYSSLPFDRVLLIDKSGNGARINSGLKLDDKVLNVRSECNASIDWMINNKILLDAIMIKNEGLGEGGGDYPLFGRCFFSRLFPILKDDITLITKMDHYGNLYSKLLEKLPVSLSKINNKEYVKSFGHDIDVFTMKREQISIHEQQKNNLKIISYKNKSIWEDKEKLSAIFVNVNSSLQIEQITGVRKSRQFKIVTECSTKRSFNRDVYFISKNGYHEIPYILNKLRYSHVGIMDCFEENECYNTNTLKDDFGKLDIEKWIEVFAKHDVKELSIYHL